MSEQKVNLNEVNSVIDEQTKLSNQIRKMQAAHKVKVKSVFTDEQLMKLEQHKKVRKHRKAWAPGSQGRQGRQGMERTI
jgi:tRNA A37 threonylcarbamoyladenosine dehydratase